MIELARHIENLLFTNDCVIVPQLGGFVTRYVPARFDAEEGLYLPPCRSVGFNPQLQLNDGLLVQSYMQVADLSYPEAVQQLESDVNQLKQQLQSEGFYSLEGIGQLTLGLNGKYGFEPAERGVVSPQLYAMEPVVAHSLQQHGHISATSYKRKLSGKRIRHATSRRSYTISINRRVADACIAALVALVVYFAWANDFTTPNETSQASVSSSFVFLNQHLPEVVTPSPRQTTNSQPAIAQSASKQNTSVTAASTTTPQPASTTTAQSSPELKAADKPYAIVLVSSITQHNAKRYVQQLSQQGIEGAYVQTTPRMVRVLYKHYATAEEAQSVLNKMRSHEQFHDAWVICTQS